VPNFPTEGGKTERTHWSVWQNGKWLGEWPRERPSLGEKIKIDTCLLKKKVTGFNEETGRIFVK